MLLEKAINLIPHDTMTARPIKEEEWEQCLQESPYTPCGEQDEESGGFVPIQEGEAAYGRKEGQLLRFRYRAEKKIVPKSELVKEMNRISAVIEGKLGFKPRKTEQSGIRAEAMKVLLPRAMPSAQDFEGWIDTHRNLLFILCTNDRQSDPIKLALINGMNKEVGLRIRPVLLRRSPSTCFMEWLRRGEMKEPFVIDDGFVLKGEDKDGKAGGAKVAYKKVSPEEFFIEQHSSLGRVPHSIDIRHGEKLTFTLEAGMVFKRIKPQLGFKSEMLEAMDMDTGGELSAEEKVDYNYRVLLGDLYSELAELFEGRHPWDEQDAENGQRTDQAVEN